MEPVTRARRSKADARQQILDAALELLLAEGPDAVRVQRVASRVGVTDAAVHYHFGNHAGLMKELLRHSARKLVADINAVLTPEQRAWIHDHRPQRCRPDLFPPLTDAQKAQIHSLEQAFRQQNRVYLDSLNSILDEARAAAGAGKSRSEIAAILAKAVPVAGVLATARAALLEDIRKVLTPAQLASGCLPLG